MSNIKTEIESDMTDLIDELSKDNSIKESNNSRSKKCVIVDDVIKKPDIKPILKPRRHSSSSVSNITNSLGFKLSDKTHILSNKKLLPNHIFLHGVDIIDNGLDYTPPCKFILFLRTPTKIIEQFHESQIRNINLPIFCISEEEVYFELIEFPDNSNEKKKKNKSVKWRIYTIVLDSETKKKWFYDGYTYENQRDEEFCLLKGKLFIKA